MRRSWSVSLAATIWLSAAAAAGAGQLVYTPINPSFGGNPLNSSHLMGLASAQRSATAPQPVGGPGSGGDPGLTPGSSDAELFIRQLQGRLLSALASQVTEAIFGEDPQPGGTIIFGDTRVEFINDPEFIKLTIFDLNGSTEIVVPRLVVQ